MTTIDNLNAVVTNDDVVVTGTVDGVLVEIHVWKSHLDTLATKALKRAYVAAELKKAAKPAVVSIDLTGTPITL